MVNIMCMTGSLGSQAFPVAHRSAFLKSGKAWDETSREG